MNVYKDATLYVPKGSKAKYESIKTWSYFYNITEKAASAINGVMQDTADVIDYTQPVKVYNLQGVMVVDSMDSLPTGFYIVRQGKNVRKVAVR